VPVAAERYYQLLLLLLQLHLLPRTRGAHETPRRLVVVDGRCSACGLRTLRSMPLA
jgi:hypothetical protein